MKAFLKAGAASVDITPQKAYFLFGYPFVERMSEGVNDPLLSSALYLTDGETGTILISNDVIYVSKASVARVRNEVSKQTGIPNSNILIAATHTHSGPVTVDCLSSAHDPVVPKADPKYVEFIENKMIEIACEAVCRAVPAKIAQFTADGTGIGTNRHNPAGPSDLNIPVLVVKSLSDKPLACFLVCNMHPTVLHEDSRLYSADFPGLAREILQKQRLGLDCTVLYFTGAAGNQSPRHVTISNTFEEARRIGGIVADAVGKKLEEETEYRQDLNIVCVSTVVNLPAKCFPSAEWAEQNRRRALDKFTVLRDTSSNKQELRTAEVDWFGAEELAFFSQQAAEGVLETIYPTCLPAEIQLVKIGNRSFVAWPGEIFVEYALALKKKSENTFLITLANGELQGYIATEEAVKNNYYEASNSLFDYSSGDIMLGATLELVEKSK
ncbi:MAG: hypothetical protein LBR84_12395 [Tannerella sp.]|jgi:hypothetical protein|nr:hypothetical protein [Tannerella sp.]